MCGGHRGEHLLQDRQRLGRRQPPVVAQQLAQRAAADVLHDQVRHALVGALVVHGDHVGMGQPGDRLRLVGEPLDEMRVVVPPGMDDLDRDGALQSLVGRGVHRRHAATGQPPADPVAPVDERTGQRVGDSGVHREAV